MMQKCLRADEIRLIQPIGSDAVGYGQLNDLRSVTECSWPLDWLR